LPARLYRPPLLLRLTLITNTGPRYPSVEIKFSHCALERQPFDRRESSWRPVEILDWRWCRWPGM